MALKEDSAVFAKRGGRQSTFEFGKERGRGEGKAKERAQGAFDAGNTD